MSSLTGEIGYKVNAAASRAAGVDRVINAAQGNAQFGGVGNTALTINGVLGTAPAMVINGAPYPLNGTGTGLSSGLQINAGFSAADWPLQILGGGNGTSTYAAFRGDGQVTIGWNSSGQPCLTAQNTGVIICNGAQIQVQNAQASTLFFQAGNVGIQSKNLSTGQVSVSIYENNSAANLQFSVGGSVPGVTLGTSALYTWGTGTHYPVLQFAGLGAIYGTATTGIVLTGGGLYYNGTNYIYGQAGTGVIASLGTGSFTISCVNTSGTAAGTAAATVVFSVGGTVTSNKIQGYGPNAAALVDMTPDTGQFNGTLIGMTTSPTVLCAWSRQGNQVTLVVGNGTGTSNSSSFQMTNLPTAIQPARTFFLPLPVAVTETGGAVVTTDVSASLAASSGTMTFYLNGTAAGWGATLAKGFSQSFSVTYLLN